MDINAAANYARDYARAKRLEAADVVEDDAGGRVRQFAASFGYTTLSRDDAARLADAAVDAHRAHLAQMGSADALPIEYQSGCDAQPNAAMLRNRCVVVDWCGKCHACIGRGITAPTVITEKTGPGGLHWRISTPGEIAVRAAAQARTWYASATCATDQRAAYAAAHPWRQVALTGRVSTVCLGGDVRREGSHLYETMDLDSEESWAAFTEAEALENHSAAVALAISGHAARADRDAAVGDVVQ